MNKKQSAVRIGLLILVGVFILLISLMALLKPKHKPIPDAREAEMPVSIIEVKLTNTADIIELPALIEANVDAMLAAEKAGRVVAIKADRGDRIAQGQLLLQIDDRIWQANLKQAGIAAENAERNYQRFKQLKESGAVAQSEYDSAEKAYIQADAMATDAMISIEQCRVASPVDGIVNDRFVETGEYVQPGMPVFQVVDSATVKAVALIPEKDVYAIRTGDRMAFTVEPLPDRTFTGTVTFVATQADGRNNAFPAEITVENTDGILRPGMIAQINFVRGINENMVSLPMSAVLPSKGDHIVYLVSNGQAIRRKVQIATLTRERALISQGLSAGDRVIIEGNRTLSDGQRVKIIEAEKADTPQKSENENNDLGEQQ
ncbi:MAG: efflux RND transporter periplasmic adaptor subunit [Pontiella sp.]|nr:efflux RND transporter periplasmic adaptor subunit [Pontiella sp.]